MNTPNTPHETPHTGPMGFGNRARWLVLATALVLLAAAVWIGTGWPASRGAAQTGIDSARTAAAPADAHAGHGPAAVAPEDGTVHLEPEQVRSLGIGVVVAELSTLQRTIRTTGNVTYNETRLTTFTPKFAGFVERLYVDFTGQGVRAGQPMLEIYSPELVAAQEELLAAIRMERQLRGSAPATVDRSVGLVEAARRRLLLWDVSPVQVEQVERSGQVRRTLTLHAPFSGFVIEKMVQAGQAVEMGMPLYRLADLGSVWVEADIYEQDLRFVRLGEAVDVEIAAYPGERFAGRVTYIYPEVRTETRTARVRAELANPGGRIKPGMFATVSLDASSGDPTIMIPRDAVMHSGTHTMVFVEEAPGTFRMREVQVGGDHGGRTQILTGLSAGERVASRANFLLDAESRLVGGSMQGMDH
jgi:membrane fusion protein, copper/silver efflux system